MQQIEREAEGERHSWPAFGRLWPQARFFQAALAAAVVLLFTLSFFLMTPRDAPSVLLDDLVKDHLRSAHRESGPADVPSADPAEILERFRVKLPSSSPVPVITHEGARLVGGSFCQLGKTKGIRFTYQVEQGKTVSLYQLDQSGQAAFPQSASGRLYVGQPQSPGIVLWKDERFLYALVGELAQQDLQRLASHMGSL
jgi:anti-sigma factor RsiW